jgi:hypothetical protein
MACVLAIKPEDPSIKMLGTRHSALEFRKQLEEQLESCQTLQVAFDGIFVTQGFVDELFGPVILRLGPAIIDRLVFSGCDQDKQAILQLVFGARLQDFAARQALKS